MPTLPLGWLWNIGAFGGALTTIERLAAYLKPRFAGAKQEKALLLSLDSRSRVKSVYWLKEGNARMVSLEVKDVVSAALRGGTESVVLCHNHPNGMAMPSREDLQATENIVRALGRIKYAVKSKTMRGENTEMAVEVFCKDPNMEFADRIRAVKGVQDVTLIQYNGEYHG